MLLSRLSTPTVMATISNLASVTAQRVAAASYGPTTLVFLHRAAILWFALCVTRPKTVMVRTHENVPAGRIPLVFLGATIRRHSTFN